MVTRIRTPFLVVCAIAALGCASDESLAPTTAGPDAPIFTVLHLSPNNAVLDPGQTFSLLVVPLDQSRSAMFPDAITYSSNEPAIATVNDSGIVTAVGPGDARITATVTVGTVTRTRDMLAGVRYPIDHEGGSQVFIELGDRGWNPRVVRVKAGAVVHWLVTGTSWAGVPTDNLWVMDDDFDVIEKLDLKTGVARRTFEKPGTFSYCSGGCWDPPDFGVIYVD